MFRRFRWATAAALLLATGGVAHAQWVYPPGYGGFGWGGWGGAATAGGDEARGLGMLAAGAGQYNLQTAQAENINAQTAMQWNQYIYLSSLEAGRRQREKQAARRGLVNETADTIYKRLRENPTEADIMRGDAMNAALDDITGPKVYAQALKKAKVPLPGTLIRQIPFNYAAAALTTSVDDLTENGPPELLKGPEFDADRATLRGIRQKLREQAESEQPLDQALVEQAESIIKGLRDKIRANPDKYPRNTPRVVAAERYLKGVYGLLTMLETPAIDVLLAGVEKRPDTTLGDLLAFMQSFNLRFGPTRTPQQRTIYAQLYPALDSLRDEIVASGVPPVDPGAKLGNQPTEFFSGMGYEHLDAPHTPPPPPSPNR
jgi:hypothetical protein